MKMITSLKQNGFTLIEFVVAFAIAAILLTAVVTFTNSSTSMNRSIVNQANAVNQAKNAYNYISRDSQMAGMVKTTTPGVFPLSLSWVNYPTNLTSVVYTVSNGTLTRTESLNGTLVSTMTIANNVNLNQTNCVWDNTNNKLTVNMSIVIGKANVVRQFTLTPRVIQSSSQTPNTIVGSSSPNPSAYGTSVTLTAQVTPSSVTSGTVTFLDGGNVIGVVPAPLINGTATYTVSNLTIGSHSLTAVFSGDALYASSTSLPFTQVVNKVTPTVSVAVLAPATNPSVFNASVSFTASVPNAATGTIQFLIDGSNFGTAETIVSGSANSDAITTLSVGTHFVTAAYSGDGNFNAANTLTALTQTVNKIKTTITVSSSAPYSFNGQSVTFTAVVSPTSAPGTVTFYDNGSQIGPGTLLASGQATYTTAALSVGAHPITAGYAATTNYFGSTSTSVTQTVTATTATFTPASGPVGTVITVSGVGWAMSDTISGVSIGGTAVNSVGFTVDSTGNLSGTITVPSLTPGLQDISITGMATGNKIFVGVFKVTTVPSVIIIGTKSSTTSSKNITVNVTANVSLGNTIIVSIAMDPSSATVTVGDTHNTYSTDADVTNGSSTYGIRTLVFSAPVSIVLNSTDTITVSFSANVTSKAVSIYYVTGLVLPEDQSATATGSSSSPLSGNTATITQDYELIFGAIGYENNSVFTAGTGFTALTKIAAGSNLTIQPEWRIVTSKMTYAASGTITSAKWAAAVVTYKTQ